MIVACGSLKFHLHGNRSLKGKRKVVKSIKDRVKNKFNLSVAETGNQDVWQTLQIGVAAVGSDSRYLEGLIQQAVDFIDNLNLAEMTDCQVELLHINEKF